MGEVYRAHDARLRRDVAIKVLPASVASDPDRLRRFEQEALATAARYKGSEVDDEAQKVAAAVESEVSGLDVDRARAERARVESILAALEARKSTGLAGLVREHVTHSPSSGPTGTAR